MGSAEPNTCPRVICEAPVRILAWHLGPLPPPAEHQRGNTIKAIKRRAYGYRDEEYFFLKIRAAFPGIPR
ncbi:hypothetical protein CBM2634_U210005 [Cupriavidus taiwanensis]|uniref:Transposase IS204/IS1001/IS1096/IS1165 DDE domain-containing protein n=1 Tax=Cupriavidus taiwanensis TaxID=164546 RepID=A0A375JDP1_9BURK|nr:hypothetical protein CBM2634_U210005 [Cupriavidus taiwanensis]